jgi:hypothetical protein
MTTSRKPTPAETKMLRHAMNDRFGVALVYTGSKVAMAKRMVDQGWLDAQYIITDAGREVAG